MYSVDTYISLATCISNTVLAIIESEIESALSAIGICKHFYNDSASPLKSCGFDNSYYCLGAMSSCSLIAISHLFLATVQKSTLIYCTVLNVISIKPWFALC